ncbi:DUF928 domain-containing protein [Nostoc sp.]|uniref:DUF928 domain-containing protein n=1 Tax=Nostoc sp. TaxID=1180 RepID=UPI002FFB14D2
MTSNKLSQNQIQPIYKAKMSGFIVSALAKTALLQICLISLILVNITSYPLQAQTQVTQPAKKLVPNTQNRLTQLKFPRNGAPIGRRQGGARRNGCSDLMKSPITALVPGEEISANVSKSFLTFTVSEYPTFWVYLPELPRNVRSGEFVFQDEKGKDIYRTPLTLPERSGVIGISLPSSQQYALKTDNKYQWYFKVFCGDTQTTSEYYYVKAWVQRVPLTSKLESQLKTAKPRAYTAYAVNHIWQDAITNLADMRRTNSASRVLGDNWTNLLISVGLKEFASAPIVGRYNLKK